MISGVMRAKVMGKALLKLLLSRAWHVELFTINEDNETHFHWKTPTPRVWHRPSVGEDTPRMQEVAKDQGLP